MSKKTLKQQFEEIISPYFGNKYGVLYDTHKQVVDDLLSAMDKAVNEIIGKNEYEGLMPKLYFGETMDAILANSHRRRVRNELRSEQHQKAEEILK